MTRAASFRRIALASGQLVDLDDACGTVLHVGRGRVWITQHGDLADHVLEAGDTWAVERNGRTILEAQQDAVVEVSGPGASSLIVPVAAPAATGRVAEWVERVANEWMDRRWQPYF
jgi:Protein of unknown function (DUF2917)